MPPTAGSEPPQVGGGSNIISLLTSSDVDRAVTAPSKRTRRTRTVITVVAVAMSVTSRRGLPWTAFFAVCPACEHKRQFIRSGRRLCPCGTPLNVIPGAEVA